MSGVWSAIGDQFRSSAPRWATPLDLACALDPSMRRTPALELLNQALVDVSEGRSKRLCISVPPQEGKTTLLQAFVLWRLTHKPELRNVLASYEQDIANRSGRRIRDQIEQFDGTDGLMDLGLRVRRGEHAVARWTLDGHAGGLFCTGIGAALTGRAVDGVLVVDDAFKGHREAMSSATRAHVWDWFRSTALTRLGPDASVIVVGTRWHHHDLIGQIIEDAPSEWRVVNIPAVADAPDDPLGREIGTGMVSARGNRDWDAIKRSVGEYIWASLYQGRPSPAGGGVFSTNKIRHWTPGVTESGQISLQLDGHAWPLETCWTFAVADLAASVRTSADFTVIAALAITPERDLVLLDLVRDRMTPDKHFEAARPLLERWNCHSLYVEQMFATMTLTYDAARAGVPISPLKADADKVTRALPAAARMEQGRVWVPAGAGWVPDFVDELAAFPAGAFDDQADCLAYAARLDAAHYIAPMSPAEELQMREASRDRETEEFERAIDAVMGHNVDFMTEPL